MVDKNNGSLSIVRQCRLLGIHRSGIYYRPRPESQQNLDIMRMLDEQYLKTPFYGMPKLKAWLSRQGILINHKRLKRLMKIMGWKTLYRYKSTSKHDKQHPLHPYL